MKYYSEFTKKFYENENECLEAEENLRKEVEEAEAEKRKASELRRRRAAEIEQARDEFLAAKNKYNKLLSDFCKDYGAYHYSIKDARPESINNYFETLMNLF